MAVKTDYLPASADNTVVAIVQGIDRDVERGEDVLMLGLGIVMLSSIFAPIAPPPILLPLVAAVFAISASYARLNYHNMERKLLKSMELLESHDKIILAPIAAVFVEYRMCSLTESFNPLKNRRRTWKSALGGLLVNPFWMPIFYVMGMQIQEEKNLAILNRAIIGVEQKIASQSKTLIDTIW
jgi:hypothetical protein